MTLRDIGESLDYYGRFARQDADFGWRWVKDIYRYVLWFEYLAISPSYELARRHFAGEDLNPDLLPADFETVLSVYEDLGDVQQHLFRQWWREVGLSNFGFGCEKPKVWMTGFTYEGFDPDSLADEVGYFFNEEWLDYGQQETIILAIPMGLPMSEIAKQVDEYIKRFSKQNRTLKIPEPKYKLTEGKFRADALRRYYRLVQYQARHPLEPHWKVGLLAPIRDLQNDKAQNQHNSSERPDADRRKNLASGTWRSIEQARMIAENAARGSFPNYSRCEHALKFNFKTLGKTLLERQRAQDREAQRLEKPERDKSLCAV
ncbi:hypothetical protein J7481_22860 [Labrenzia sp. R4_2]|uniref:hypothetical protein n=1 Tax=Labrenzia sp. R4_2 TaxID=2821107 RepID=UPI001ADAABD6|nr:hypothetical protein [Labrenzia sp. R4_2]MBO9422370.1 hypothetical protein [Labrenzia sp. R4_2]